MAKAPGNDVEYLEPTLAQRLKLVAVWATSLLLWLAIEIYWHGFMDWIQAKPLCDQVQWLQGLIVAGGLLGALLVWVLARLAWKLHKHGQMPPPGTPVFFRTRIYRGARVQSNAYVLVFLAMSLAVGVAWLASTDTVWTMMVESRVLCAP